MPLMYRTMKHDGRGPCVGVDADMLGARDHEVALDAQGRATPGRGISVAPDWRRLPAWRIPKRLRPVLPLAAGRDDRCIWSASEGPFVDTVLTAGLRMVVTDPTHGQIEPAHAMPVHDYQALLAGTRSMWSPIHEDPGCPARRLAEDK